MTPRRWIIAGVASLLAVLAIAATLLIINWPFTEPAVAKALEDRFTRNVKIGTFRRTYFPPGFIAQNVEFLHRKRQDLPPLITVQTLTVRGSYSGLLRIHQEINTVLITGLHVLIPPKSPDGTKQVFPLTTSVSGKNLAIGEIATDNAVLEFMPRQRGADPFVLHIDHLVLDHVGENDPLSFHARFNNTDPPGEIHSDGQFGPWDDNDPGATTVSGSYTYQHVNLAAFEGIAGTLSSAGKFSGTVGRIDGEGNIDVPDFKVTGSSHVVHLSSTYQAVIDGTNGDTHLSSVESHFGRTTVLSQGDVKGSPSTHGKTLNLAMNLSQGSDEDLLRLFTGSAQPAENGDVRLQMKVNLPPGPLSFLRRLRLDGDFGIGTAHFTDPTIQLPVNRLAESAHGETKDQEEANPATVLSDLKGHVTAKAGIAQLSSVSFTEPGTLAEVAGTYNLLNKTVNLKGVLHTNGKLADTTSGFKSVVLKALSPFIKKKSLTVVPFTVTGTSSDPSFSLDLLGKR